MTMNNEQQFNFYWKEIFDGLAYNPIEFNVYRFDQSMSLPSKFNKLYEMLKVLALNNQEVMDYLKEFVETFDKKLYETIEDVLTVWLEDGRLSEVVRVAINEEVVSARTDETGKTHVNLKARLDDLSVKIIEEKEDLLADMAENKEDLLADIAENKRSLYLPNGKGRLKIPVYNAPDNYQATHPHVLYFADGFLGFKFWLAYTPYTLSNEWVENPSIVVSNDGMNWDTFPNHLNPLVATLDGSTYHYSDTHLVKVGNTLECWYRKSYRGSAVPQQTEHICRMTTTNGVNWTPEEILFNRFDSLDGTMCPVVLHENGIYKIWVVNYPNEQLDYFESSNGFNWQLKRNIDMPIHPKGFKIWHMDIVHTNKGYELYYDGGDDRHITGSMCYAISQDNVTYTYVSDILQSMPNNFDEYAVYRPCVCDVDGYRWLYYGGQDNNNYWGIGLTIGKTDTPTVFRGVEAGTTAGYFKKRTGAYFPAGVHTESVRVGTFTELKEHQLKLTKVGVTDMVMELNDTLVDAFHVRQEKENRQRPYAGMLMHRLHLWDALKESPQHFLSVENGKLRFFDGQYNQFVSVPIYGYSANRPTTPVEGYQMFDREIGKAIWWHGGKWVDAMGSAV